MLGTPATPAPKYGPRLRRQEMQDFLMGVFFFFLQYGVYGLLKIVPDESPYLGIEGLEFAGAFAIDLGGER